MTDQHQLTVNEETPAMYERFTDRARRTVVLAQERTRLLGRHEIDSLMLLYGLVDEGEAVAAIALAGVGINEATLAEYVAAGEGSSPSGHIPFTPGCKRALELGLREALQLGHNYIGPEHLLLGLVREGECDETFVALGTTGVEVRNAVITVLSEMSSQARRQDPTQISAERPSPATANPTVEDMAAVTAALDAYRATVHLGRYIRPNGEQFVTLDDLAAAIERIHSVVR